MENQIITVFGPVSLQEMGITDAHNHLWISVQESIMEKAPVLNQEEQILIDLHEFRRAGGGGQIDCQPGGAGRDGRRLRSLSKASEVKIVTCTGFHLQQYYPDDFKIWKMSTDQAAGYFLSEIKDGLEETRDLDMPVYPGFIKIAVKENVRESPLNLIEAAAFASLESGFAIEMHTEKGSRAEDYVDLFFKMGVSPKQLVICHIDKRPDLELHKELAQAGCLLEYDTFFRPKYKPEENLWQLIQGMIEANLGHLVALATDLADSSLWNSMGDGPGLVSLITIVKKRLEREGYHESIVAGLVGKNIVRRLAVAVKE